MKGGFCAGCEHWEQNGSTPFGRCTNRDVEHRIRPAIPSMQVRYDFGCKYYLERNLIMREEPVRHG
jgi:hypothetical protein